MKAEPGPLDYSLENVKEGALAHKMISDSSARRSTNIEDRTGHALEDMGYGLAEAQTPGGTPSDTFDVLSSAIDGHFRRGGVPENPGEMVQAMTPALNSYIAGASAKSMTPEDMILGLNNILTVGILVGNDNYGAKYDMQDQQNRLDAAKIWARQEAARNPKIAPRDLTSGFVQVYRGDPPPEPSASVRQAVVQPVKKLAARRKTGSAR